MTQERVLDISIMFVPFFHFEYLFIQYITYDHCLQVSVEVADTLFSIAEVEHCVLRFAMSKPNMPSIIRKAALPNKASGGAYQCVNKSEPRINFILNTGTLSCLDTVSTYTPDLLEKQLATGAAEFLDKFIEVHTYVLYYLSSIFLINFGLG